MAEFHNNLFSAALIQKVLRFLLFQALSALKMSTAYRVRAGYLQVVLDHAYYFIILNHYKPIDYK